MTIDNQEKKSTLNEIVIILTIIFGLIGLYCLYSMIASMNLTHHEIGEGFGILAILIISITGLILCAIVLGISMEHELKNRRLTIIPVVIFFLVLVLAFF